MRRLPLLPLALAPALLPGSAHASGFAVGVAFDLGGRADHGLNQAVLQGVRRALNETGGEVQASGPRRLTEVGQGIPGLVRGARAW